MMMTIMIIIMMVIMIVIMIIITRRIRIMPVSTYIDDDIEYYYFY
jgi:hypothetical protein